MFPRVSALVLMAASLAFAAGCGGSDPVSPAPPPPPPPPPAPVASLDLTPTTVDLVTGEPRQLTATPRDAAGIALTGRTIAWTTSAPEVATVQAGLVTGVTPGPATITASVEGKTAQATVTITEGGWIPTVGGSFSVMGGLVGLTVPVNAVPAPVVFRAAAAVGVPADPRLVPGTAITLTPPTNFASPATLRIRYPTGLAADVVLSQLQIGRLLSNVWEPLPATVDLNTRMVSASITSAGSFAVLLPLPSLRGYAQARAFRMGAAVNPSHLTGSDLQYPSVLASEFSQVVPENVMKFGPIHPQPTTYSFGGADALVNFAQARGQSVHGHVLLWHSQQPGWITAGTWTRATLLAALKSHVETVVTRYKGRIESWDAANEMIADPNDATATPEGLRNSFWIQIIGPDVIDSVFTWAARADPDAKLYLNDYSVEHPINNQVKINRLLALAQRLQTAGIPIHGIGLQGHLTLQAPTQAQFAQTMAIFTNANFDVRISELDVRIPDNAGAAALQDQAAIYRDIMRACLANARCTGITTWGFTDKHSWVPGFFSGFGRALPFDANYAPKPAYTALFEALRDMP